MPGRDGTGPLGRGPKRGGEAGTGRGGAGMGRGSGGNFAGPDGYCVCPECGERLPHRQGIPCNSVVCPKCGLKMIRGQ